MKYKAVFQETVTYAVEFDHDGEFDLDDESQWFEALDTANPRWWRDHKNIVDVDDRELVQLDKIMPRTSKTADAA